MVLGAASSDMRYVALARSSNQDKTVLMISTSGIDGPYRSTRPLSKTCSCPPTAHASSPAMVSGPLRSACTSTASSQVRSWRHVCAPMQLCELSGLDQGPVAVADTHARAAAAGRCPSPLACVRHPLPAGLPLVCIRALVLCRSIFQHCV